MRNNEDTPLQVAIKGLVAGSGGAVALTGMVTVSRKVMTGRDSPDRLRASEGISAGQALSEGPACRRT